MGTPLYMSPKAIQQLPPVTSNDRWAIGVMAYRLILKKFPFFSSDKEELLDRICRESIDYRGVDQIWRASLRLLLDEDSKPEEVELEINKLHKAFEMEQLYRELECLKNREELGLQRKSLSFQFAQSKWWFFKRRENYFHLSSEGLISIKFQGGREENFLQSEVEF